MKENNVRFINNTNLNKSMKHWTLLLFLCILAGSCRKDTVNERITYLGIRFFVSSKTGEDLVNPKCEGTLLPDDILIQSVFQGNTFGWTISKSSEPFASYSAYNPDIHSSISSFYFFEAYAQKMFYYPYELANKSLDAIVKIAGQQERTISLHWNDKGDFSQIDIDGEKVGNEVIIVL